MTSVASFFMGLLVLYGAFCGTLFLTQRQMLYPRHIVGPVADAPPDLPNLERIWLEMEFGRVEAWYFPPKLLVAGEPYPAVIFGHGNGEVIDSWPAEFMPFTEMGVGLMLVEYPGYGRSEGRPSQKRITGTFVAAYDRLTSRPEVDGERIVLVGRSLGGGAVCQLAKRRPSAAMILISTFTSTRPYARQYLAPAFLMRDTYDNLAVVRDYANPILIFHGKRDKVVPYRHGEKLVDAAPNARLVTYNCGHNDCPPDDLHFWHEIERFLREASVLGKSGASRGRIAPDAPLLEG